MKLNGKKSFSILQEGPLPLPFHTAKGKQSQERHLYSSDSDIFVSYRDFLLAKDFTDTSLNEQEHPDPKVKVLKNNSLKITCVGLANKPFLLCTCSDDAVYLWKKDSLLREWGRKKVVKSLGKILHCAIFATEKHVFIALSKLEEIIIIHCSSYINLESKGSLDLSSIEIYATIDKIKEPNSWVACFVLQGKLNVVGLAQGNGISLRLWDVSRHNGSITTKLQDHKTVPQIKFIASADLFLQDMESYLVLFGIDGQVEILLVTCNGFSLMNRLRIDDSLDERIGKQGHLSSFGKPFPPPTHNHSMKAEFHVLNGCFLLNVNSHKEAAANSEADGVAPQNDCELESSGHNDSLIVACENPVRSLCPQLLAVVATTKKILCLNLRSGEVEMSFKYEDLDANIGVMVNTITLNYDKVTSEIVGAMQLMMDKNLYFFRVGVDTQGENPEKNNDCFLISGDNYSSKSVLRKKLKSPRNNPPKGTKSLSGLGSKRTSSRSRRMLTSKTSSSTFSPTSGAPAHLKSSYSTVDPIKKGRSRSGKAKGDFCKVLQSPRTGFPLAVPPSPRQSIILGTKSSYEDQQLLFESPSSFQLPQRLSESGISSIRIGQSHDGKLMTIGANVSPLLVLKTQPFENLRLYKDTARVSSANFAFNSNYLLVATNDCKTTVLDWRGGKELLEFKFTSKFNEHIGSQFYFMDKFILQAEENRLAFYSYAFRDSGNIHLQAGSFPLACQSITAIAAANQFYSNFVICGLSSKCLQVFDANTEQIVINVPQSHSRPLTCIRLNEAPKGCNATSLCNFVLTSAPSSADPIKLWDLRTARSVSLMGDVNLNAFVSTARPALSPCGRYIATGFEDNKVVIYDVRKINSRVYTLEGIRSTVLDCAFDTNLPLIWCAARNGALWSFIAS